MKLCVDCKYYEYRSGYSPNPDMDHLCHVVISPVTGARTDNCCAYMRAPPSPLQQYNSSIPMPCGPDGRLFEAKAE